MNLYEHTIIARQDTSPSELKQLTEKYSKIVEKNEGEVVKTENWGLLNLSYLIKKNCPLSIKGAPKIDYKNIKLLKKYVSENGKILPSRITNVSQKKQRELSLSIKRARNLALI